MLQAVIYQNNSHIYKQWKTDKVPTVPDQVVCALSTGAIVDDIECRRRRERDATGVE